MTPTFYSPGDFHRVVDIPPSGSPEPYRTDFRRDYARIIHCPAFRRLQRKTQLFPGEESDFFRNRLTHSLEVAQIAKSIALRLNFQIKDKYGEEASGIDCDLVELASLAHDLGHPPFGHTGEYALHSCMHEAGGFEGNAQTLRILSRLEKRQTLDSGGDPSDFIEFADGRDQRAGLNLCFRSLAAILKYDACIPVVGRNQICKGYYKSESDLVLEIKKGVLGTAFGRRKKDPFRVIEMQIMDLADDIAYSTYDFEDALKAGFVSPIDLLQQLNNRNEIREAVARKLFKSTTKREFPVGNASDEDKAIFFDIENNLIVSVLVMLSNFWQEVDSNITRAERRELAGRDAFNREFRIAQIAIMAQKLSDAVVQNGYVRAQFTSDLVGQRIRDIGIEVDEDCPALSKLTLPESTRFQIDVLKHLTYELHIKSPRLKLVEYRGHQIISDLFKCYVDDKQGELLPRDWRERLRALSDFGDGEEMRKRLVCDFISGMTDVHALDVYSRLKTTNPAALFRPF